MCIESIDRHVNDGFTLPGGKLDDGKAEHMEANLSVANVENTTSVTTLVATNAALQEKIKTLEEQHETKVDPAVSEPKTPVKIPQPGMKVTAVTPTATNTKRMKPTTAKKNHNVVYGEEVIIKESYSNKPGYAGKTGNISSHANTMVTVDLLMLRSTLRWRQNAFCMVRTKQALASSRSFSAYFLTCHSSI